MGMLLRRHYEVRAAGVTRKASLEAVEELEELEEAVLEADAAKPAPAKKGKAK